jgi:hypothetical protein
MGNPDLKEYKTTIQIEGNNEDNLLRPNMSATVEIIIAQLENVIYVPQAAVFSQGAVRYAWVDSPPGPVATPIETGEHNESYVVITKGLEAGQRVYLVEPRTENTPEFKQPERRRVRVPAAPEDEPDDPEGNAPNGPARVTKTARRRGREPGGRDEDPGPGPDTGNGGTGDGGTSDGGTRNASARRGPNMNSPAMAAFTQAQNQFKQVVKEHNPDLHQKIEAAGRGWSRDASIKAAIAADAGLTGPYASFEAARKTLMSSFGGRGRGKAADGQPGGGQGGGGQGGRRRRGGAERQADDAGDPEQPRREGDGN